MSSKDKIEKKSTSGKSKTKTSDKPAKTSQSDVKKANAKSGAKTASAETSQDKPIKADKADKADKKAETVKTDKAPEEVIKEQKTKTTQPEQIKLSGLYAFKLGMSSIYDEQGHFTPVTLLQVKPCFVSQIKTQKKEGYSSVQMAFKPQKNKRVSKPLVVHLSAAGFKEGAAHVKEVRQSSTENIKVGQEVSINSLEKGDIVKLTGVSKGHGFAGVVKRWGFKGGPASHGAKTHRTTGSIGNRTEPARVMPGKKMPGHYGVEQVSIRNVKVMDVVPDEKLILIKGPVPGARNSLVYLHKNQAVEKRKT